MGRINRKRKLSPSSSKVGIVEDENGGSYAEITDAMGNQSRLSLGAMRLLQAIDDDVSDDEYMLQSGQRTPLVKLEDIWSHECLREGWMTSRVKDVPWLSPAEIESIKRNQSSDNQPNTTYLRLSI